MSSDDIFNQDSPRNVVAEPNLVRQAGIYIEVATGRQEETVLGPSKNGQLKENDRIGSRDQTGFIDGSRG